MKTTDNYLFQYTVSGEGYSDPTLEVIHGKEAAEKMVADHVNMMTEEDTDEPEEWYKIHDSEGESKELCQCVELLHNNDFHQFRAQPIETDKPFILVKYYEPNEVVIEAAYESEKRAKIALDARVLSEDWEDEDEMRSEYSTVQFGYEHMAYGAHGQDGYVHYEILENRELEESEEEEDSPESNDYAKRLETILEKMRYNTTGLWQNNLEEKRECVLLEDIDVDWPESTEDDDTDPIKYNGWYGELEQLLEDMQSVNLVEEEEIECWNCGTKQESTQRFCVECAAESP